MPTIDETLARLKKSKFRAKFHLTAKDKEYITNKGIGVIRSHAKEFVIACERNDNRFFADTSWAMIFIRFFIELWKEWWSERKNTRGSKKPRV